MSVSIDKMSVRIKLSWWLRVYLNTLGVLCNLTGMEPNNERVGLWISKGVRVKIDHG